MPDGSITRVRKVSPVPTRRGAESYEREVRTALLEGTRSSKEEQPPAVPTLASFAAFFIDTYATTNKLSHANVVAVYDVETLGSGEVVLVMEYVAGQPLSHWLREERPWSEVLACFIAAGRGLQAAHAAGLLHTRPPLTRVGHDGRVVA